MLIITVREYLLGLKVSFLPENFLYFFMLLYYRCPEARIVVDGAHALLSLPLNIDELHVDYYVSNCHKWFSAPKGTAFMYVKKKHQNQTRPLVISHGWGSGFNSEFIWQGEYWYK